MNTAINAAIRPFVVPVATPDSQATDTLPGKLRNTWMVLRVTFSIVPIVAGLDKFTNLLTDWEKYLNPMLASMLPFSPHVFMEVVGVIEVIAGIMVFFRPRLGALIVTAWLGCIAVSLLASGHYLDVAVRDLVMAVAAFTLARLTADLDSNRPDGR